MGRGVEVATLRRITDAPPARARPVSARFPRTLVLLAIVAAALAACGDDRDPPRPLLDAVGPPSGLIAHCRDSLRTVRAPQLVCSGARGASEWFVRLDGSARVGTMSRFTRVGQGHVAAAVDSARAAVQERLGNGKACHSDAVHYWQRRGWVTFLSVQGSGLEQAVADSMMTVIVGVSRDPTSAPWPECDE